MLRAFIAIALVLCAWGARAACSDTIMSRGGDPENGVDISDGGCAYPDLMINGTWRFDDVCKPYRREGFACRKGAFAPLSDATYVPVFDAKPHCGGKKPDMRYKCIKGCAPPVHKYLYVVPYEC